jgi:integrase
MHERGKAAETILLRDESAEQFWPGSWYNSAADMIRKDMEAARNKWINEAANGPAREQRTKDRDFLQPFDSEGKTLDFHGLRHTYITRLVSAGIHPKVAQQLARHSTITLTYGQVLPPQSVERGWRRGVHRFPDSGGGRNGFHWNRWW